MTHSPFSDKLWRAIGVAYGAAPPGLSGALEVCSCNCCMDEPTRQKIIKTPMNEMPGPLVQEYSNSAHGGPVNLDDLSAFLPRYLDLLAQGEPVDYSGVGAELLRFGDAVRAGGWPEPALWAAYQDWARAYVLHCGWLEAVGEGGTGEGELESTIYLFEMLPAGGIPAACLTDALDALFALPDLGDMALAQFLAGLGSSATKRNPGLFALGYVPMAQRQQLADWLNQLLLADRVMEVLSNPAFKGPNFWQERASNLFFRAGVFDGENIAQKTRT